MTAKDLTVWLTIAAAVLSAGMWLGGLSARVDQLEKTDRYFHGADR